MDFERKIFCAVTGLQPHPLFTENSKIHYVWRPVHFWHKSHLADNLCLNVYAGRYLGQINASVPKFKYGPFGNIQHRLSGSVCVSAAECNLFYLFDKFFLFPFLQDFDAAVFKSDRKSACGKGTAEKYFFRILGNVDKAAASGNARAEFADVDVSGFVCLGQAEECVVYAAAVIKVELVRLV